MTRLELVQALQQECGVSGTISTTVNQTGEFARLVNWIDRSWNEIQTMYEDWDWMRSSNILGAGMSFVTVNLQTDYPFGTGLGTCEVLESNFGKWKTDTFRCNTTSVSIRDEVPMGYLRYDNWRDLYMLGARRLVATRPTVIAVAPDKTICIQPPTNAYTITGDYYVKASAMTFDADVPLGLPTEYSMIIVYRAMQKYGRYEAASEVIAGGEREFNKLLATLQNKYLPELVMSGAIA